MVRPRKYRDGYRPWTLMRLGHGEEVYRKAEELAERERIPISELVLKALADHVKAHYPGNPQIPLGGSDADYREYVAARRRAQLSALLETPWPDREAWLQAVDKALDRLMAQPDRGQATRELIHTALNLIDSG